MRKILTILCLLTIGCISIQAMQKPKVRISYGQEYIVEVGGYDGYVINVKTEMTLLNSGLSNLSGDGITDDGTKLNNATKTTGGAYADAYASYHILFFPTSIYLFNTTVSISAFTKFIGVPGGTIFKTTVNSTSYDMFRGDGKGDWTMESITFTNNQTYYINSLVRLNATSGNSNPSTVKNIKITNCRFVNSWVSSAVWMSGFPASNSDVNTWVDNLVIEDCNFEQLMKPGSPHLNSEQDYFNGNGSQLWCGAINLQQCTLGYKILRCNFYCVAGDGIHQYGATPGLRSTGRYMGGEIAFCYFNKCNMCVECNGGYSGDNLWVHNNRFYYSWFYNVSISCTKSMVKDNYFEQSEYGCLEWASTEGQITDNEAKIRTYGGDTATGYARGTASTNSAASFLEGYGFFNHITENTIRLDRSNPTTSTPTQYNAFKVCGPHREATNTQDTAYLAQNNGRAAYWWFKVNHISGVNSKLIDATNSPVDEVHFDDNDVTTNVAINSNTGAMISEYGNNWTMYSNKYNFTGVNFSGTVIANTRTDNGLSDSTKTSLMTGMLNELSGATSFAGSYFMKPRTQVSPKYTVPPAP